MKRSLYFIIYTENLSLVEKLFHATVYLRL